MFGWVRGFAAALAAILATGSASASADHVAGDAAPRHGTFEASFRILRDGAPVGEHRYRFSLADGILTVSSNANATVTMLGLPVYRFTQTVREVWRDGRLVSLEATTDDNGVRTNVSATATVRGLVVDGPRGRAVAAASAVPTTYWNIGTVRGAPLIDTRDGEVMPRRITPLAWERIAAAGGSAVAAQHYRVDGHKSCHIWYDGYGVWQRAACQTEHGWIEDVPDRASGDRVQLARMLSGLYADGEHLAQRQPER